MSPANRPFFLYSITSLFSYEPHKISSSLVNRKPCFMSRKATQRKNITSYERQLLFHLSLCARHSNTSGQPIHSEGIGLPFEMEFKCPRWCWQTRSLDTTFLIAPCNTCFNLSTSAAFSHTNRNKTNTTIRSNVTHVKTKMSIIMDSNMSLTKSS